jgi:hypothetical protein
MTTEKKTALSAARSDSTPLWQKIALVLAGTSFGIGLLLLLLYLFPNLIQNDPLERGEAGTSLPVEFHLTDGDYFFHQAGRIRPPAEDTLLASFTLSWDANGFRVPAVPADSYPIAAFGDSFTEGTTVAMPWPDLLAANLGVPVQNFGYRGYGPRENAETAREFLGSDSRSWILYMHFSGNDLLGANKSLDEELMGRNPIGEVQWLVRQTLGERATVVENPDNHYDYPVPVIIGGSYYEMALLEDLLWWQIAPEEGFLATETVNVVGEALDTIRGVSPEGACRAFIFAPSKEQIYYQYIPEESRRWLRENARVPRVREDGRIALYEQAMPQEEEANFMAHLSDQRDAMRELAEQHGWLFIDLLEAFEQAALERGLAGQELLYFQYDGHWTPSGNELASQVIADFMREASADCPLGLN